MNLSDFDFELPEHLIAQHPLPERDQSRMMVVWRETGKREHHIFRDLPKILDRRYFLVMNNTRVFPARLRAARPGRSEQIEILLIKELNHSDWLALLKPARKAPLGQELRAGSLRASVLEVRDSGSRVIRFEQSTNLIEVFKEIGEPPLPPYIRRQKGQNLADDALRYQTVYARHTGSVAAPTAGLHFTNEVLRRLETNGIQRCEVLLHVGYGTFQPVRCNDITRHRMEPEYFEVNDDAAACIRRYKNQGRRLVAVGTTTTRCLEFLARSKDALKHGASGLCDLFIYPGFEFRLLDSLLTNFHLPCSSLLLLVCAFAGRELVLDCYQEAIAKGYRFFSYGDCMLFL